MNKPERARQSRLKEEPVTFIGDRELHQVLTELHIVRIRRVFFREESKSLTSEQLERALEDYGKLKFAVGQFKNFFLKINISRNGSATWDEFISHLILGFKIEDVADTLKSLDLPIDKKPRIIRSYHRHPINWITFHHQVKPDRNVSYSFGSYLTCSKDGVINYWSLDFKLERTAQSTCPDLKVMTTWVLCCACLSDCNVVCTASTERDLRFYDTSARKFVLRVQIRSIDFAVVSMSYIFHTDLNEDSKLMLGDMGGNVRVLMFNPTNRGPFRSRMGVPLLCVQFDDVMKGLVEGFKIVEFKALHNDWVRQVEYFPVLNFIVSCSSSPRGIVMRDINENRGIYEYFVPGGVWTFCCADGAPLMASGGPDCLVRVWNPYVPKRPLVTFHGHHTGIISLAMQDKGEVLASLSEDKCLRVWDVVAQQCLQTYLGLGSELGEQPLLMMFYNPDSRQLIIGGCAIAVLPLRPLQNGEHTDGNTHYAAISVLLWNPLFGIVLTCGLDSIIMVWNPWSGKRISAVRNAHTRMLHGEIIPVDITAGTFDPGYQLLLTGAHDGSLKTWNFNTGTCLRNMRIEPNCEVTGVCWVVGRIMAVGWNKHVTEFAESGGAAGPGGAFCKNWTTKHTDDVLCAASRIPQSLATSTYNGELVLWRLETGQPYKQYSVANPTARIKITYEAPTAENKKKEDARERAKSITTASRPVKLAMSMMHTARPLIVPDHITPIRGLAVRCMIFLTTRPMLPDVGTLFVALENGNVQVWSHHVAGGFISSFQAVHTVGDYIVAMATDEENNYLFCGTTEGYIKTFLMQSYLSGTDEHVCKPLLRLKFPFMWNTFILGRAIRALRGQELPIQLNSYRAHRGIVSGLIYIDETETLISSSSDFSARMWTLGGRYLNTLGTFKTWQPVPSDGPVDSFQFKHVIPPDIKRIMSSTTWRVLLGYEWEKKMTKRQLAALAEKEMVYKDSTNRVFGKRLQDPILGNFIKLPEKTTQLYEVNLESMFPYIPVYMHLVMPPPIDLPRISPPKFKDETIDIDPLVTKTEN